MRASRILPLAVCAALAGCGAERDDPPDLERPEPPRGSRTLTFERAGLTVTAPANWRLRRRRAPGVFTLASGGAIVSAFAYRREEPLPRRGASLEQAKERLLAQVRRRDPRFRLLRADTTSVAGAPAITIDGEQTLSRRALRTRSVHVYEERTEYVFEALAPRAGFELASGVLAPLLQSMRLRGARR